MIYISHLLPDDEMKEIISQTGVGIESIEFSIADNLDHLYKWLILLRPKSRPFDF